MTNSTLEWLVPASIAALTAAYIAGRQIQALANQRLATKALHERLDRMRRKLDVTYEYMLSQGWIRPTTSGTLEDD
jgi:hypothetical protein